LVCDDPITNIIQLTKTIARCALKLIFTFVSYSRVNCFRLEIKGLLHQKKNKKKQQKGLLHQYHGMNNTRAIVLVNCMIFVMGSSQTNIYVYLLMVINVCIYINLMKSNDICVTILFAFFFFFFFGVTIL
jgi:hypothetical protein